VSEVRRETEGVGKAVEGVDGGGGGHRCEGGGRGMCGAEGMERGIESGESYQFSCTVPTFAHLCVAGNPC